MRSIILTIILLAVSASAMAQTLSEHCDATPPVEVSDGKKNLDLRVEEVALRTYTNSDGTPATEGDYQRAEADILSQDGYADDADAVQYALDALFTVSEEHITCPVTPRRRQFRELFAMRNAIDNSYQRAPRRDAVRVYEFTQSGIAPIGDVEWRAWRRRLLDAQAHTNAQRRCSFFYDPATSPHRPRLVLGGFAYEDGEYVCTD